MFGQEAWGVENPFREIKLKEKNIATTFWIANINITPVSYPKKIIVQRKICKKIGVKENFPNFCLMDNWFEISRFQSFFY